MIWYEAFSITESGTESVRNEDFRYTDAKQGIFVVADGMGGRPKGKLASKTAVNTFVSGIRRMTYHERMNRDSIRHVVESTNEKVRALSCNNPELTGIGTTLTSVILNGIHGHVVHVGDSRMYLFHNGCLSQLTTDHTLVEELVKGNHISPDKVEQYPYRHVLSRCVGTCDSVEPDIEDLSIESGDLFLLTTDGLPKVLKNNTIEQLIQSNRNATPEQLCRLLVKRAMKHEVYDDLTAIVIRVCNKET